MQKLGIGTQHRLLTDVGKMIKAIFGNFCRLFILFISIFAILISQNPYMVSALSKEQKKLYQKNILYYDKDTCSGVGSDENLTPGRGAPTDASFPNLDPDAMAEAINKYMKETNPNGKLNDLGETIVAGAKNSNLNPFIVVSIAQKESGLGDPNFGDGFNVREANNSFGRSAISSQPNVQGAKLWYKWSSIKASVDHTANENKGVSGGGDIAAYIRNQYGKAINGNDIELFMNAYAPEGENDTAEYIRNVKQWTGEMARLTKGGATAGDDNTSSSSSISSDCSCGNNESAITLAGKNNEERVWNYFADKGLSPLLIAGIMGNFKVESNFDPTVVYGGSHSNDPASVTVAWGLAQWLPGSKVLIAQRNAGVKGDITELSTQLEIVWWEMNNSAPTSYQNFLKDYKKINNLVEARKFFQQFFEGSLGQGDSTRDTAAQEILTKYGSGTLSGGPEGNSSTRVSACSSSKNGSAEAFSGTAQEAAKALLGNKGVQIFDDRDLIEQAANGQPTPLNEKLIKLLAGLAQNHDFGISSIYRGPCSGSNHCTGNAADINPTIDGQTISYSDNNPKIQAFIDDAAKILGGNCENGVPNQEYVSKTKANGSKCEVFLDIGTGPHVHLSVSS